MTSDTMLMLVIVYAALLFGLIYRLGARVDKLEKRPVVTSVDTGVARAICGCAHHFSFHDPKTGLCHHKERQETKWDDYGDAVKWERVQCGCQRYVGPEPLESLYAPEIAPDVVEEKRRKEL